MRFRIILLILLAVPAAWLGFHGAGIPFLQNRTLARLPSAVRQTVVSVLGSARLQDVVLTNENGRRLYEVEMRQRGQDRAFTVAADGSLLSRQMFMNELPVAVRQAIQRETAGEQVQEIYWTNEEGAPAYFVEFLKSEQNRTLTVAPDGWVMARQIGLSDTPAPVQAAIRETLHGRAPRQVDRASDGDEITYEVYEMASDKERLWIFNQDGTVAAEPVDWEDLPAAARAALHRESSGSRMVHLFKLRQEGTPLYEAALVREELRHVCTVDGDGRIVSEELPLKALPEPVWKSIVDQAGGRFLLTIEKRLVGDSAEYEVSLREKGRITVLRFSSDGTLHPKTPAKNKE
ncbi:MAG: hypothetical protein NTW03_20010 [Verrucomicrobia bacterium]|nr:hypothetical protein [Verrucomicrobiota bacterium]